MSCSVKKGKILKQGSKTSTVLTNRSNFITIVTDEPYKNRFAEPLRTETLRKGVRPLNKSTLCLEISPLKTSYESCMKSVRELINLLNSSVGCLVSHKNSKKRSKQI